MRKSKKRYFYQIFTKFSWGRPWGNHAKCWPYGWKENSMLTNCLAECAHLTITVSQTERDIGQNSSFFHTPLHSTPPLEFRFARKNENGLATKWWKNFQDIFIRFGATHERDRQTDRHRVPAYTALMHSIAR